MDEDFCSCYVVDDIIESFVNVFVTFYDKKVEDYLCVVYIAYFSFKFLFCFRFGVG